MLANREWQIDGILSHTCPRKYEPIDIFISGIDQSKVDKSTEDWLDELEDKIKYRKWYCGHFHVDRQVKTDRSTEIRFMFTDIEKLD